MSNYSSSATSGGGFKWLRSSIRAQLGVSFALLTAVLIIVVTVLLTIFSVNQFRDALTDRAFEELEAVRTLKAIEVHRWIEERKSDIRFVRELESVQGNREGNEGLNVLSEHIDTPTDQTYVQAFERAKREIEAFVAQHGQDVYNDVLLINTAGNVVFALNQENLEINEAEQATFQNALNSVYFGDLFYNPTHEAIDLRIGAPVKDLQGVTVGVIILELNPQQINELMIERTGLGETGETYLIGQDYLFRNDSRFLSELGVETTILNETIVADTAAVRGAFDGQSHTSRIEDYRGESVLSSWTPIVVQPPTPDDPDGVQWALIAEIDEAEALASVDALTRFIAGLSAGLIVLAGAIAIGLGVVLANRLINPIVNLTNSATQVASGDLETEVPTIDREDEVGVLAQAFRQMTDNLRDSIGSLRQRGEELENRDKELSARTEQLEANQRAVRVVFAASEQSDPEELLRLTVNLIRDRFDMYHVQVYLVDEEKNAAVLSESTGYAGLQLLQKEHQIPLDQPALVTRAIHEGEPVVVNDVNQSEGFLANPLLPDTQSEMVVPLQTGERVIGAVDVQSRDVNTFTPDRVSLFETMTDQIALLFQNSELYVRTIEQTEELTNFTTQLRTAATVSERLSTILDPENLLNEVVELLQSRFGFYHAHIYMLDEENERLVVRAGSGEVGEVLRQREHSIPADSPKSLVARAARERQVVVVNDTTLESGFLPNPLLPQTRAEVAVPLITGGNLLGVLDVQDDQPNRFAESDMATFNTLAGQIATALDNARLFEEQREAQQEIRQRAAELQTVAEVSTSAATVLDPDELLQDVVDLTKENFSLYHAHIYLIDNQGENLELAAGAGEAGRLMKEEGWSIAADSETSLVARAFRTGAGVIENDVQAAPDFLPNPHLPDTRAEMAVPMIAGDRVLGVLDVQSEQVGRFTQQDVNIKTTLAEQVATALDNARLFEEQRRAEQNIRNLAQQNELILNSTAEGIYGVNSEGVTTFVNAAAAEMLGWSPEELIGERHHHLIHHTKPDGSHYPVEECKVYAAYRDGELHQGEDEIYWRKDGTSFPVSYTSSPILDEDGNIQGAVISFRDITEELAAREATEKRARELQTVAEVSTSAATVLDPEELLQDVVDLTKENFGLYHAHIYLINDEGESLELAAGAGEAGQQMAAEGWSIAADSETSLVARAFRTREGVIVNDVREAPDFLPNPYLPDTRAEMAVPMIAGEHVLGVLDIQSDEVGRFTQEDINIQTTLASQIAAALDNARLFDEQRRLTALLNNSDDYIALANPQGEIIYVNPGGAKMTGYDDPSELIGMRIADSHTPEDTARVLEEGVPVAMQEGTWRSENRLKHRDGHLIPVDQTVFIIRDEDGEVETLATIMIDITDRLEAERRIREINERFTLAKEAINLGVWDWDVQNDDLVWDDTMYRLYGINKEDFSGAYEAWQSGLHPEDAERAGAALQAALEGTGEFDVEFRVVQPDGEIRHLKGDAVIIRDDDGAPLRAVGMNYDITEQKKAEQEIIQRAAELQTVAEVSTSAATVLDPDELLQDVVDLTKENFGLYHAHIYLIDDEGQSLELAAGADKAGREMAAEGWSIPADSETSLVARAFRSGEGVIENDVREAPDFLPNPYLPDTRAEMAVPMIAGERVVGVLDVQSERVGRFTQEDVNIKTTLAEQVATALDNARLFAEQRRLTAILNNSNDFIALTDLQGGITYINPGGMEMLGYEDLEKVMSKVIPDFHTPEDTARVLEEGIPTAMEEGIWRGENRLKHRDGYLIPVDQTVFVIRDEEGAPQNLATIMIDVTEQKEAERQLRQRAAELQTVAEVSTSAATVLEPEELLQEVVDLTKEDFDLYHAHIYLIDEASESLKLAAGAGEAGQQMVAEGWSIAAESKTSLVARAYRSREGVIVNDVREAPDFLPNPYLPDTRAEMAVPMIVGDRVLGVLDVQSDEVGRFTQQDVNIQTTLAGQVATALDNARLFQETQEVADRLREVDRMKSEFLANMSHELRTPLNSILGYTQLLLLDLEDTLPQESLEDMQSIHLNGQHLLSMINDILDLAKIEAGRLNLNFEELQIGMLLESVQASNSGLFLDKPVEMVIDMEEDVPAVWADSVRMTQVLNNLVANAVKFTDEGEVTIRAYKMNGGVNIEVEDEGIGINEEDMDKLFERFRQIDGSYTRRAEGTGLGLPITRHLVEMHGGNISVESEVGKGSTFTIHLPNIEAAKAYIEENVEQFIEEA